MLKNVITLLSKVLNKYFKLKWTLKKSIKSIIGISVIVVMLCILITVINVMCLSTDSSIQNTLYNVINSLVIGVISSTIVTIVVEINNWKSEKKKRLAVLHGLNFDLCSFCHLYALYAECNEQHPKGHSIFENDKHFCDKYVFINSIVRKCEATLSSSTDYLNPEEISILSCIVTNYGAMKTLIGADLLSMFEFDASQHQLEDDVLYDDLLTDIAKHGIPELFNDIIEDIKRLKLELELEGFEDIFKKYIK